MTGRTTIRLPQELLRRAKRKATAEGRTLTALIEDGLRRVVAEGGRVAKERRVLPPVSNATGGTLPGIDLSDHSALQEQDDRDEIARMQRFK